MNHRIIAMTAAEMPLMDSLSTRQCSEHINEPTRQELTVAAIDESFIAQAGLAPPAPAVNIEANQGGAVKKAPPVAVQASGVMPGRAARRPPTDPHTQDTGPRSIIRL